MISSPTTYLLPAVIDPIVIILPEASLVRVAVAPDPSPLLDFRGTAVATKFAPEAVSFAN